MSPVLGFVSMTTGGVQLLAKTNSAAKMIRFPDTFYLSSLT